MHKLLFIGLLLFTISSHAQRWDSINAKGLALYKSGNYSEATKAFQQALILSKKQSETKSQNYISTLSNLAFVYKATGEYTKASKLFRLVIRELDAINNVSSIETIEARINLANLLMEQGQYDSCEIMLQRAATILELEKSKSSYSLDLASHKLNMAYILIQNNKASLKKRLGQLNEGVEIIEKLQAYIKEKYLTQYDSLYEYRALLSNLVNYYIEQGKLDDARRTAQEHERLVQIYEPHAIAHLYSLQNLGNLYRLSEHPDSAILIWNSALSYINQGHFLNSELHLSILSNLGELYGALEDYDNAISTLHSAKEISEKRGGTNPRLYQTILFNLAESYHWSAHYAEADETYELLTSHLLRDVLYSFTYLSEAEKIAFYRNQRSIIDSYLFFALSVSGAIPLQKTEKPYINENITSQLYDLQIMTKGIILNASHKMKKYILESPDESLKAEYNTWELMKVELSNQLSRDSPDTIQLHQLQKNIEDLEIRLSRKSAHFKRGFIMQKISWNNIQKKLKPGEAAIEMVRFADGLIYGALIITSETKQRPALAIIKSKENRYLEKDYYRQYINATEYKIIDSISYDVYWRPIIKTIKENLMKGQQIKRIFFSPDGIYNQININTLFDVQEGKYVIDQVEIVQLTNTKVLTQDDIAGQSEKVKQAILLGRPAFTFSNENANEQFVDLAGTETEIEKINSLLKDRKIPTAIYKGVDASELTVKRLPHHNILHLATHGFFYQSNAETNSNSLVQIMLNSGIVLAGSNHPEKLESGDGILTAYEALSLNLEQTDLVVLSACETGLGEFHPGEGLYGLRLALRSAGAQASIMSLWKVDDEASQELMTSFYRIWLTQKFGMQESFRMAQQQLRANYPQPYYWGAFILVGK